MKEIAKINTDSLKTHIEHLKYSLDSIKTLQRINEVNFKLDQKLDVVNSVNQFYDSAWLKLVFLITILGILVPFIIQYFQRLSNKEIFEKYNKDYEAKLQELKLQNQSNFIELTEKYNSEITDIKDKYEKSHHRLIGNTFFLQGRVRFTEENHKHALNDFIFAAESYLKINRVKDIDAALSFVQLCINGFKTKVNFEQALKENEIKWDDFLNKFSEDIYLENIKSIKQRIEKLE